MINKAIRRVQLVKGGTVIKQGEIFTLGFQLFDADGTIIIPTAAQTISVKIANRSGVVYETTAKTVDDHIEFTVDKDIGHGETHVELKVSEGTTLIQKYPADGFIKLKITGSLDDLGVGGVGAITVTQLRQEQTSLQTEYEKKINPKIAAVEVKAADLAKRVEDGIGAFTEDTEVLDARLGEVNLGAFNRKLTAQLAETDTKTENLMGWELKNRARKSKPLVVFVSDDGERADLTNLKPVFDAEGVKCVSAIVPSFVGKSGYMNLTELKMLEAHGWEIASHTYNHPRLTEVTDTASENEFKSSKEWFDVNGFKTTTIHAPYGFWSDREKEYARKYYRAMRVSDPSLNVSPIETYQLKSTLFGEGANANMAYYKTRINEAISKKGLLIFLMHGVNITGQHQADLAETIQYCKANGVEVTTLEKALDQIGNIVDVGNFKKSDLTQQHFVVGANGNISSSFNYVYKSAANAFINTDSITKFEENKITITPIQSAYANGFPENTGGMLYTFKLFADNGFNYQEYVVYNSTRKYRRACNSAGEWGGWVITDRNDFETLPSNSVNNTSGAASFPIDKTSVCQINTANASGLPENIGGILTTYRYSTDRGYIFQEYTPFNTNRKYIRSMDSNGVWNEWELLNQFRSVINTANISTINALNATFAMLNNYTIASQITAISGGKAGQELTLYSTNSNITFVHDGAKIRLKDKVNFNAPPQTAIKFICIDGSIWAEVSRTTT